MMVLTYEFVSRPGETLRVTRADLLLPEDLLVKDLGTMFVKFNNLKSKKRGIGRVQPSKSTGRATRFISKVGHLAGWVLLYPGSAFFRCKWNKLGISGQSASGCPHWAKHQGASEPEFLKGIFLNICAGYSCLGRLDSGFDKRRWSGSSLQD